MKSKKQILSLLLALCLITFLFGILPGTVSAEGTEGSTYGILVNGIQVADENKDDILGDEDGEAQSVTFDPETNTLTLNDANFVASDISGGQYGSIIWAGNEETTSKELTIRANGDNFFNLIRVVPAAGTLTLTGSGSITLTGSEAHIGLSSSAAAVDLVFDDITFSVEAKSMKSNEKEAISGQDITIRNGANVTASSETSHAISALGQITIDDSTVTASARWASAGDGLHAANNSITVTGDSDVTVVGGVTAGSFTISPGDSGYFAVSVGENKEDAKTVEGSPFKTCEDMLSVANSYNYP